MSNDEIIVDDCHLASDDLFFALRSVIVEEIERNMMINGTKGKEHEDSI